MSVIWQIINVLMAMPVPARAAVLEIVRALRLSKDPLDAAKKAASAMAHETATLEAARLTLKTLKK